MPPILLDFFFFSRAASVAPCSCDTPNTAEPWTCGNPGALPEKVEPGFVPPLTTTVKDETGAAEITSLSSGVWISMHFDVGYFETSAGGCDKYCPEAPAPAPA